MCARMYRNQVLYIVHVALAVCVMTYVFRYVFVTYVAMTLFIGCSQIFSHQFYYDASSDTVVTTPPINSKLHVS